MHARPRMRVTTPPRGQQRLNKRLVVLVALGALLLVGLAFLWWHARKPKVPTGTGPRERPVAEYVVTEKPTPLRQDLRLPSDYTKLPLEEVPPKPPVPAPATPGQPAKTPPPSRTGPWGQQPRPPTPPQGLPPPPSAPVIVQSPSLRPAMQPTRTGGSEDKRPARWYGQATPIKGGMLTPPHPPNAADTQASKLFPKAVWEKPKDPTKVLYANQVINGQLSQNINSDFPGTVRIKVTQDVVDRWGHGNVLLRLDTDMMATMDGQAKYGQKRIPLTVYMALPPDGSAITFVKSQAGDAMGAVGVPANVNNHYGSLILGAGIQAFMNIGTRAVAGSTTNFNPTLEQEFAQDIARSANRTANRLVERETQRNPTLEQEFAFPVTIQFSENISFQSQPTLVSK